MKANLTVVLVFSTLALLGRSAGAQVPTVISSCVDDVGHVRIVASTDSCRPHETPLAWNTVGPKGDKGDSAGSLQYPQGLQGTPVLFTLSNRRTYTVPTGKTLYLTTCVTPYVDGVPYVSDGVCPMFPDGTEISGAPTAFPPESGFTGVLMDESPNVEPTIFVVGVGSTYTVPVGKRLVLISGAGQAWALTINGVPFFNARGTWLIPSSSVLGSLGGPVGYTGYLVPE